MRSHMCCTHRRFKYLGKIILRARSSVRSIRNKFGVSEISSEYPNMPNIRLSSSSDLCIE